MGEGARDVLLLIWDLLYQFLSDNGQIRVFHPKGRFPLGGILRAERNFSLSFLNSSTREITRQRKSVPLRAGNSA